MKKHTFDKSDLDLLEMALELSPNLKTCVLILKRVRSAQPQYPIANHAPLIELLDRSGSEIVGRHKITASHIKHYMTDDLFPIDTERELAQRVYLGLCRCSEDSAWAARAPSNAEQVLADYQESRPARETAT